MMKQQLFKVLFICMVVVCLPCVAYAAGDIAINATNFPDDGFRNYLLEQDFGKDGVLTEDEIKSIESLSVVYRDIRSLEGIEYFTALTKLFCYNNQLTVLDVSKNEALTMLSCGNNQLTALDVSKNAALTRLSCGGNQLTALDVSGNTALTTLGCDGNQLTHLDVSKNTALTNLGCCSNQLTSLDVSGCTALVYLACYENQLASLNVSGCTALINLYCSNNQLSAIDVSGCAALTELECSYNQLTALDVSKNTALTMLAVNRNQIRGASMDNLINSLPINKTYWPSQLRVYSPSSDEGNVCTKEQVKAAKEKGWRACYYDKEWLEYEGSDGTPSNIDDIRTETVKDAPIYNLRGERLTAPQKGVNIIGGRKVVMK